MPTFSHPINTAPGNLNFINSSSWIGASTAIAAAVQAEHFAELAPDQPAEPFPSNPPTSPPPQPSTDIPSFILTAEELLGRRNKRKPPKNHDPNKDLWWKKWALEVCHTGSRVICEPPPRNTDDDWVILVDKDSVKTLELRMISEGFKMGGSGGIASTPLEEFPKPATGRNSDKSRFFHSWRKDDLNVVVTISPEYFWNFSKATDLACKLNLTDKSDRIALFEAVVYDIWP